MQRKAGAVAATGFPPSTPGPDASRRARCNHGRWWLGIMGLLLAATLPKLGWAAPVQYSANGHYYEAVSRSNGITWDDANSAANARMFNGMHGHLAVVPTPAVNTFLVQHFPGAVNGGYYLGGIQPHGLVDPAAGWQWLTGEPWSFTNWNIEGGNQPDDFNGPGTSDQDEDRLCFYPQAGGTWDDLNHADNSPLGYVVEYEPDPAGDPPMVTGYASRDSGMPMTTAAPGTLVQIQGTNLGSGGTVLFDGVLTPAAVADWTPTQILIWIPTAPSYPSQGMVTVLVDRQQARGPAVTITAPAAGKDNLLANGSFEYPSSEGAPFSSGYVYGQPLDHGSGFHGYTIPGWRIPLGTIDVVEKGWHPAPGQGLQSIDLVGTPFPTTLQQTFFTTMGQNYILSGWMAHNPGVSEGRADVYLNDQFFIQLHHKGFTSADAMDWTPFSFRFRATDAQTTLAFIDTTGKNNFQGLALDGLSVTVASN